MPLSTCRTKLERAAHHLSSFGALQEELKRANNDFIATRVSGDGSQREYFLQHDPIIPTGFATAAGDTLHNLRGALDHLAYSLSVAGPGGLAALSNQDLKGIYFPITVGGRPEYRALPSRALLLRYARQGVEPVLDAVEPYRGGAGDLLCSLSALNNIDKHRLLFTVALQVPSFDVGNMMLEQMRKMAPENMAGFPAGSMPLFITPADKSSLKAGDLVFAEPIESATERVTFKFPIAIDEPTVLPVQPLLQLLGQMTEMVNGLLPAFEPFA